jgi:DNA-binding XRE family transcriptional regulator
LFILLEKKNLWNINFNGERKMRSPIIKPKKKGTKTGYKKLKITDSNRTELKEAFLVEYRKEGMSQNEAATKIGFRRQNIYKWAETDPVFAKEFEELNFKKQNKTEETFAENHKHDEKYKKEFLEFYSDENHSVASALKTIAKHLKPSHLKYWCKTDFEFKKEYKRLQVLLRPGITRMTEIKSVVDGALLEQKQQRFLDVFGENNYNVTNTCRAMGVTRAVVKGWEKKNPDFSSALDVLQDEKEDFAEDAIIKLVKEGNMVASIFLAKVLLSKPNFGRRHAYIDTPQPAGRVDHVIKFDQDQLDAMVRGRLMDRNKYEKMLSLDDPTVKDAEYEECEDDEN